MLLREIYGLKQQDFLKYQCKVLALASKVDADDIFSLANEKLARQMYNGFVVNDDEHLYKLLKTIAYCSLNDIVSKKSHSSEALTDPALLAEPLERMNPGYEAKDLLKKIDEAIRKHFARNDKVLNVYDRCILQGYKLEEVAKDCDMNLNTIKTNMRMVRRFANKVKAQFN